MLVKKVDMVFDDQTEDLKLDDYGGLSYYSGIDTAAHAVVRRLGTPPEGYARMIRVGSDIKVYNNLYASQLPLLLSTTNLNTADVQTAVELAAKQDSRITPVDFAVNRSGETTYSFTLSYLANDAVQSITTNL